MVPKSKTVQADVRQELLNELHSLRATVRDIGECFILRKEGEIEALTGYLLTIPAGKLRIIAKTWLRESRGLNVKPAKGRMRDLKKLDKLLGDLLNSIIEIDHEAISPKTSITLASKNQEAANIPKDEQL